MILTREGTDYYYLFDIESGYPYKVSKEYYEWYNKTILEFFNSVKPNINPTFKGTLIMGTAGDFENNNFEEMFYNPDKYDIRAFPNTWENYNNNIIKYFKPTQMARQFTPPGELGDNDPMPIGKHKGEVMEKVPAKYLLYMYENYEDLHAGVKTYIEKNLDVIKQQAKVE